MGGNGMVTRSPGRRILLACAVLAALVIGPRSAEAQLAFEPTVNVSQTDGDSRQPHVALDPSGVLHVAWADEFRIFYARSFDQGLSFETPVPLSIGPGAAQRPRLAAHGDAVFIVWMEDVSATKDVFFRRSLDGGNNFAEQVNLSTSAGESREARIAVNASGKLFVVWDEETPSRHIALATSTTGGTSFEFDFIVPLNRPISSNCVAQGGTPANCTAYPGIAVDPTRPQNVYVNWHDWAPGTEKLEVFVARSTNAGESFETPTNVSNSPVHAHCAAMTVGPSGKVVIAWEDRKEAGDNHYHNAFFAQSTDGGATFGPRVPVSQSPNLALSDYPWPAEGPDGTIVVGYEDNATGGSLEAVVNVSHDGGGSFGPRQDVSQTPGGTSTEVVTLFGPDGTLYVLWQDHGDGPEESDPAEILLARAPGASAPGGPIQFTLLANAGAFGAGDPMQLSVTAQNPGPPVTGDVYVGALLPPPAGPLYGCSTADAVVLLVDDFASSVSTCVSQVPANTLPVMTGVTVPTMAPTTVPLFGFVWPPGVTPGPYTFFIALMGPGALTDGSVDAGDILALAMTAVTFGPP
ncbi:MAG: sialidase family protein [Candidatus Rokuibacteriota bacterium]